MSLDIDLIEPRPTSVFTINITHNLGKMAREAGVYLPIWRPEEIGITKASDLRPFLEAGLFYLSRNDLTTFNASNGWGKQEDLISFMARLLVAVNEHPLASIEVSR